MELPDDLNELLRKPPGILKSTSHKMAQDDIDFMNSMLHDIEDGAQGVVISFDSSKNRLRYMVLNGSSWDIVWLTSKVQNQVALNRIRDKEQEDKKNKDQ